MALGSNTIAISNPNSPGETYVVEIRNQQRFEDILRDVARKSGMCTYCGAFSDHIKRDCPKQNAERSKADCLGLCRYCEERGHFENACPHKPRTTPVKYARATPGTADSCVRW